MLKTSSLLSVFAFAILFSACSKTPKNSSGELHIRPVVDTVGFAHLNWQMDSITARISSEFSDQLAGAAKEPGTSWRAAICPHDDYTYASWLYPAVLKNIRSKTVIIFGVAHRARVFDIEKQLVLGSFDAWQAPYGNVPVSSLRNEIIQQLPKDLYVVHDSMQAVEHSIESMIPFLQQQNRELEIVPILVPRMPTSRMDTIAENLAAVLKSVSEKNRLTWGKDISLLITTDAVHYGDEDWNGWDYAPFGCDSAGYAKALALEYEIIDSCFTCELNNEKTNRFYQYTVQENDYRAYKWTWCGRYSVPLGLKVAWQLQQQENAKPLVGIPIAYETTISQNHIPVDDLGMGRTAVATPNHWVGFAAMGFK